MRAAYTGHEALTFNDYLDLGTGRTLTAEPGGVYDVAPSGARPVPAVPPGFAVAEPEVTYASAGIQGAGAAGGQHEDDEGGTQPDEQ